MLHYARTGDFVRALLVDARNANEYAFALGALAHFTSDTTGHPAVNSAVAIEFPNLQRSPARKLLTKRIGLLISRQSSVLIWTRWRNTAIALTIIIHSSASEWPKSCSIKFF